MTCPTQKRIARIPYSGLLAAALIFLLACVCWAQEAKAPIAPHARLLAARSLYIQHQGASIPYDVISNAFQGWGHYIVVYDPGQADLIASIYAPGTDSGISVSGSDGRATRAPAGTSVNQIRLTILDAHDHVVLWSGFEQPKSAFKERDREDHLVDSSLKLFRRFRSAIEPEPAP